MEDLTRERIVKMSKYLSIEGIANSFHTTPDVIQRILNGEEIDISREDGGGSQVIKVLTKINVHKQRVISVWRAKGGVGTTLLALNLARMASENYKTLLMCLNFSEGGSDLIHYVDLPYFPVGIKAVKEGVLHCTELQNNLSIMQPITRIDDVISPEHVRNLILEARRDYDCIILDLPNSMDSITLEAVSSSNTIVFIAQHTQQECQRIARTASIFDNKEIIYVSNCMKAGKLRKVIQADNIIEIAFDKNIPERLENQAPFLPPKSPFYQALESVYGLIFDEKAVTKKGLNKKLRLLKIQRRISSILYGINLWDRISGAAGVLVTVLVLVAALYSLDVPFAKTVVYKFVQLIKS